FRSAFGCTPSTMRRRLRYEGHLPTPNGVHFDVRSPIRFVASQGGTSMQVEIREFEPRKAVCMTHRGPYYMIGQTFAQLVAWLKESGTAAGPFMALSYAAPEAPPPAELRSDAGAFVPDGFAPNDPRVHLVDVAGGTYAVGTHIGPY